MFGAELATSHFFNQPWFISLINICTTWRPWFKIIFCRHFQMNFSWQKTFLIWLNIYRSAFLGVYPIDVLLVQAMDWHLTNEKPLPEATVTIMFLPYGITKLQWISTGRVDTRKQSSREDPTDKYHHVRSGNDMAPNWWQLLPEPMMTRFFCHRYGVTTDSTGHNEVQRCVLNAPVELMLSCIGFSKGIKTLTSVTFYCGMT